MKPTNNRSSSRAKQYHCHGAKSSNLAHRPPIEPRNLFLIGHLLIKLTASRICRASDAFSDLG